MAHKLNANFFYNLMKGSMEVYDLVINQEIGCEDNVEDVITRVRANVSEQDIKQMITLAFEVNQENRKAGREW